MSLIWTDLTASLTVDPQLLTQSDMLFRVALQILLLVASAFFSGSETALFSLSRYDMQQLRREKNPRFNMLQNLLERPRQLIISILCGNEIINIAATINMTGILVILYGETLGGILSIVIMVPMLLMFGEITPKTIAVSDPIKVSTKVIAPPLSIWIKLVAPFRWVIRIVSDRLTTWIVGEETAAENILKVDEFRTLIDEVAKGGELTANERALIYNLLDAGTTEVIEIMIPRTQVAFIDADMSMPDIVEQVRSLHYTRLPVFRDSRDNLIGFIHAEDILQLILDDEDFAKISINDVLRPPIIVPPTKKIDEMFDFFLNHNVQAVAVLNEFGGIDGLVTMKRVLRYVFGTVTPETAPKAEFIELDENIYEVAGEMKLTTFNDLTNFEIDDPRMTTIGGVVLRSLDRLPQVGDELVIEGITLTVLKMREHRIMRLRVAKMDKIEEST